MLDYNSPEYMAKVLDAYNIDYTQPKVICPFHADVNPSMSIDLAKSRVYCFGCQKSYSAFQFVEAAEPKLGKLEVYKRMAEINKGKKVQVLPQHIRNNSDIDFEQLLTQAEDYYYNLPKTDWLHGEWTDELDYLVKRGFEPAFLNSCGAKLNYNPWYPIIFPLMDNGVFKGWVCRTNKKEVEAKRKYLYNTGFRRATTLCGIYSNKGPLVIVEGYMDMLRIRQSGYKNVIAILGWKMSKEQRDKLASANIKHIVSALDKDESGEKGYLYLNTLGFEKVERWPYKNGQKDPGDQDVKTIKRILKLFKKPIDKRKSL